MRWYEIISESVNDLTDLAKNSVLDILTPLQSMGVKSITLPQVLDQLNKIPELQGMNLTNEYIMDLMDGIDGFTIELNETGVLAIKVDDNDELNHGGNDKDKEDKSKEKVNQAAMNTVKRDMGK